jgi:hypothetical protein
MASLRKRYQGRVEVEPTSGGGSRSPRPSEDLPATAVPTNLKLTPEAPPQPEEPVVESNPVEDAAQSAIKQRLAELERAETLQRQPPPQPQPQLSERDRAFLDSRPGVDRDPRLPIIAQAFAAKHEYGSPDFYEALESAFPVSDYQSTPPKAAPPRRQSMGGPVSAPVSRESPSWSSGRPASESTTRLTPQDRELAAMWNISEQDISKPSSVSRERRLRGFMMSEDDRPYTNLSPTKIRLGPIAREICRMHGNMSETEMARHLLQQEKLRQSGLAQKNGEN